MHARTAGVPRHRTVSATEQNGSKVGATTRASNFVCFRISIATCERSLTVFGRDKPSVTSAYAVQVAATSKFRTTSSAGVTCRPACWSSACSVRTSTSIAAASTSGSISFTYSW